MYTIEQSRTAIINKWDWEDPSSNVTVMLWGPPGIGKTWLIYGIVADRKLHDLQAEARNCEQRGEKVPQETIDQIMLLKTYTDPRQIEDLLAGHMLVLRLAERPIEQIEGVPAPDFEKRSTVFLMPDNLVKLRDAKWVVVFVDELDKASESKMAAATHLVESCIVGDFRLPYDTFIVCAANRVGDSWLSKPISPELCNRMAHVEMEPDVESWCAWAAKAGIVPDYIKFLKFKMLQKENYLMKVGESNNDSPKAFVSPRTFHKASNQEKKIYKKHGVARGQSKKADDEVCREVEQLIGDVVASELFAYIDLYSKVNVQAILDGTQKIPRGASSEHAMSEQYIYAFALSEQLTEKHLASKQAMKNFVAAIDTMVAELRTVFFQLLNLGNRPVLAKVANSSEAKSIIEQIIDYIRVGDDEEKENK